MISAIRKKISYEIGNKKYVSKHSIHVAENKLEDLLMKEELY